MHQVVAGRGNASARCRRSLEIRADVIAVGYLHLYVLARFVLPPVEFTIRYHEPDKHDLPSGAAVDYLFIGLAKQRETARGGLGGGDQVGADSLGEARA
jgi:hypothetical protein